MLDLTKWYRHGKENGALPEAYSRITLGELYEELGLFPWMPRDVDTDPGGTVRELPSFPYAGMCRDEAAPGAFDDLLREFREDISRDDGELNSIYLLNDALNPRNIPEGKCARSCLDFLRDTAELVHQRSGLFFVRVSGHSSSMLGDLAVAGVDCIEGVCCPPQGNTMLMKARDLAGKQVLLWGGLPSDALLPSWEKNAFKKMAQYVAEESCFEPNVIIGAAGGVPPGADIGRIRYLIDLFRHMEEVL